MPLAVEFPPVEFLIFAVAMLLALIGKIVDFSRKVRQRSIEAEEREGRPFGEEAGEAPEPLHDEAPPARIEIVLRRPLPRPAAPRPAVEPPPARPAQQRVATAPWKPSPVHHPILGMLREPQGARNAIILAEILGRRRWR